MGLEQETIEKKETDSRLEEKDGELFIRVDNEEPSLESEEEAGTESEEEKTGKEKSDAGSGDGEAENAEIKAGEDYVFKGDDVPATYRGKTAAEVMKMHQDASDKLVRDGQEKQKLREQIEESNLTPEQIRERLGSKDLKQLLDKEVGSLVKINQDLDPDGYEAQNGIVHALRTEYMEKRQDERTRELLNNEANESFKTAHRKTLEDQGFSLNDVQYENVIAIAGDYAKNAKLTPDAVQHALIDTLGLEIVTKTITMKAEGKTREDIRTAQGKEQPITDVGGSGKSGSLVSVGDLLKMSEEEFDKATKDLTPAESAKLRKRIEARGNI